MNKNQKVEGITLIALVVTIIILLILAGIAINQLTGENGLLTVAKNAKSISDKAKIEEDMNFLLLDYKTEQATTGITLESYLEKNNYDYEKDEDGNIKIEQDGYLVTINPITLEMDGPTETNKMAKIKLSANIIEPNDELTVTLEFGSDVDVQNCKYLFEKSNVTVEKENVTTPVTSRTINDLQTDTKGEYYFYLLVAYKDSTEPLLKKVKVIIDVSPTGISLNKTSLTLNKGNTENLVASVLPENAEQGVYWSTSDSSIVTVNSSGLVTAETAGTAQITATSIQKNDLKAVCTVAVVEPATITYIVNGSTYSTNTELLVGDTVGTLPTNPSITGRTFKGWYDAESGGNEYFSSSTVNTSNLTLYAQWTCTVSFESNGGSSVTSQIVDYGMTATEPTAPTKQNNVLVGWYSDSALSEEYSFSTAVTGDITLYAKWRFEGQLSGVAIGDYVDIGVSYTCQMNSGYTGWRVLDDGSSSGVVKLISAGCPLKYQFDGTDSRPSAEILSNLYSSTLSTGVNYGRFTASGFANSTYDMTSVFGGTNSLVDISAGAASIYAPKYSMVRPCYTENNNLDGTIWAIDTAYWLASCGREGNIGSNWYTMLDYVYKNPTVGNVLSSYNGHLGVRMILTLKSNVRVSSSNTGNGSSSSSPWALALQN